LKREVCRKMEKYDVTALGELLIDFTENGSSTQGNPLLEANPGGAPCNVLAMLAKLGHETAFIGKVGRDMFGDQLEAAIREVGIHADGLKRDVEVHTTLAFVHTAPDGDRDFSFYRNPGADMMLGAEDVDTDLIGKSRLFHFGTLSMTHEKVREATKYALKTAKENRLLISFDPNVREPLWDNMETCREMVEYGIANCDILKISDNEIIWFTGLEDFDAGLDLLLEKYSPKLILLSMGRDGSMACTRKERVTVPAFIQENTIETTGAGDTFCACVLHYVLACGLEGLTTENMKKMLVFANAAASIVTTRKGALRVMPDADEIRGFLRAKGIIFQ